MYVSLNTFLECRQVLQRASTGSHGCGCGCGCGYQGVCLTHQLLSPSQPVPGADGAAATFPLPFLWPSAIHACCQTTTLRQPQGVIDTVVAPRDTL